MKYEIIKKVGDAIIVPQEISEKIRLFKQIEKEVGDLNKKLKSELLAAMEENGAKGFETEGLKITYIDESETTTVNMSAMKDDGIFDKYAMKIPRDAYVRITLKKVEKDE